MQESSFQRLSVYCGERNSNSTGMHQQFNKRLLIFQRMGISETIRKEVIPINLNQPMARREKAKHSNRKDRETKRPL